MSFSDDLKLQVKRRAHFMCCLCHALGVEVHHVLPQEDGGRDTEDNAAPLCPSCHETYGANPQKRKFIREARDLWYEICEKRFAPDPDRLDEIGTLLKDAVTKKDLDNAVDKIVNLLRETGNQTSVSTAEKAREIAQVSGSIIAAGVGVNRYCRNCHTSIGLFIGDQGRCPNCGKPW
jgi:hypothetical protein